MNSLRLAIMNWKTTLPGGLFVLAPELTPENAETRINARAHDLFSKLHT